jgi:hypothetical protein
MACTALYSVGAGVGDKQDVGRRRSGSSVKARYLAKLMENEAQYCAEVSMSCGCSRAAVHLALVGWQWVPIRVVAGEFGRPGAADGQLQRPHGLRYTTDGSGLVVADGDNGRVNLFLQSCGGRSGRFVCVALGHRLAQFFATSDSIAIASMSPTRVGWMAAAVRVALGHRDRP